MKEEFSRIYVLRPSLFFTLNRVRVYENEDLVGKLGSTSYLNWDTKEDEVLILSKSENEELLKLKLEPGKTYYIRQKIKAGFITPRTELTEMREGEALKLMRFLKEPKEISID